MSIYVDAPQNSLSLKQALSVNVSNEQSLPQVTVQKRSEGIQQNTVTDTVDMNNDDDNVDKLIAKERSAVLDKDMQTGVTTAVGAGMVGAGTTYAVGAALGSPIIHVSSVVMSAVLSSTLAGVMVLGGVASLVGGVMYFRNRHREFEMKKNAIQHKFGIEDEKLLKEIIHSMPKNEMDKIVEDYSNTLKAQKSEALLKNIHSKQINVKANL